MAGPDHAPRCPLSPDMIAILIVLAIMLLVAFPVHEFSHALVAYRLGDGTAKLFRRLTLNPMAHFDPVGGTLLAVSMLVGNGFGFGWAKPTPVNPLNLRGGRQGEALVALAGPVSNFVMACLGALIFRILDVTNVMAPDLVVAIVYYFVLVNLGLMLFNLVPIPPLDGSKVLFGLVPPRIAWRWQPVLEQYGGIILLVAVFLPILPGGETLFGWIFRLLLRPLMGLLLGL
jgi:Zn-dependent protease